VSVRIRFSDLWTYAVSESQVRLPLSQLGKGAGHIHGRLEILISEKTLPHLGYFGPSDVCFNTWVPVLREIKEQLSGSEQTVYVFDEGEQGQPAFEFKREFDIMHVSVIDSAISDGSSDPSYQLVSCLWSDFKAEIDSFFGAFRGELDRVGSGPARSWWEKNAQRAA